VEKAAKEKQEEQERIAADKAAEKRGYSRSVLLLRDQPKKRSWRRNESLPRRSDWMKKKELLLLL
jgi:hypothetical protein